MTSKNKIMEIGLFPLAGQYFNGVIRATSHSLWLFVVFLFGPRDENSSLDELDKWYLRVTIWSAIGTTGLAIIAFVGNFNLIANLAFNHGIQYPMAYLIPLALDGFVIISILIVLGAALVGQKATAIKFLVLMSSLTGIYFNVADVISGSAEIELMSILLHSVLGAMLYLAVEVTAHQITSYIRRKSTLRTSEILRKEISALNMQRDDLKNRFQAEYNALSVSMLQRVADEEKPLMAQVESAKEELGRLVAQSKKASQINDFTEDDVQAAFLLGQNPSATGQEVATLLGKNSASIGNAIKRKIKPIVNGAMK